MEFQSTRPVWGVTYFLQKIIILCKISIHTPRVGRDTFLESRSRKFFLFQSTRPVWGVTMTYIYLLTQIYISIHTPRVGRDDHKYDNDLPIN